MTKTPQNKSFLNRWLPVIVWAGVIFFFSSRPIVASNRFDLLDFIVKKSAHVTEYAIFFTLLNRALRSRFATLSPQYAFFFGLLYAFTDEIHQLFTPGRGAKLTDVLIFDTTGLLLAWKFSSKINLWMKHLPLLKKLSN